MAEWFSITELAEKTEIPEPSCRRYIAKFHPYFISKGGARAKKYDSTAVDILKRIQKLYAAGYETAGVADVIKNEFPVIIDGEEKEEAEKNAVTPALATAEDMAELKEALKQQAEFNRQLLQNDQEQRELIKALIKDREEQKQLMNKMYESFTKALPAPDQQETSERLLQDQQEINERLLKELAESKQRDQLLLEKMAELTEKKEAEVAPTENPAEEKTGFFKRFFQK